MSCSKSHRRKKEKEFVKFHPGRSYYQWIVSRALKKHRGRLIENIVTSNPVLRGLM